LPGFVRYLASIPQERKSMTQRGAPAPPGSFGPRRGGLAIALGCLAAGLLLTMGAGTSPNQGRDQPTDRRRVPWKDSKITGTPDPPLPYVAEPAFPNLALDRPVALAQPAGEPRLFVAEVGGKVRSFPNDAAANATDDAIDLAAARQPFEALYGLAFHPRFAENRQVFLCYVTRSGAVDGTRVSRFTMTRGDPPRIEPASELVLLTFLGGGHNGGCLAFGPDGCLCISTGDAADPAPPDPLDTGQDIGDLLSSILRIDVDHADGDLPYRVPRDNPFVDTPGARPEVWAYGFRNPWRMSFDRVTGDLWVGDVGWELWELVHRVERGGNYGWSVVEGPQPVRPDSRRGPTPIQPPVVAHPHSEAASITGGHVYRGRRLDDLAGLYVYGDYQSGKVWGLRWEEGRVAWRGELADTGLRLVAFGEDAEGELYLIEYEHTNQIYRLAPNPAPAPARRFPRRLSETGLCASTRDLIPAPGVIPYAINAEAWADGTAAERWLAIPGDRRIAVDGEGHWRVPEGTVLARTVAVDLEAGDPATRRRIETQILHFEDGSWRPYTYAWNEAQSDAELVGGEGASRRLTIRDPAEPGGSYTLDYRIAARSECILCHNPWVEARTTVFGRQSASPLAFGAAQWDRAGHDGSGPQLVHLHRLGFFDTPRPPSADDRGRLADPRDPSAPLDARARAYLHVNCAHCHQFGGGGTTTIALGAELPADRLQAIDAPPTQGAFGLDEARIIAPGAPERSVLCYRVAKTGPGHMPRSGATRVDAGAVRLLADWIAGMPGGPADPASDTRVLLARLADARTSDNQRWVLVDRLAGSTSGALALNLALTRGVLPETVTRQAATLGRSHPKAEVRDLFERFLPESERVARLGDAFDPEAVLAMDGDAERGRRWFFGEAGANCRTCHKVRGQGGEVGPDLSEIGAKYGRRALLDQIRDPSRQIEPAYKTHGIATVDGQVHVGRVVERTDRHVSLRDAQDRRIVIALDAIEQEADQATSLMPEGLLRDLTAQEAADLLAFLASLRDREAAP
jgi:putative heme-binding domain-containing protein